MKIFKIFVKKKSTTAAALCMYICACNKIELKNNGDNATKIKRARETNKRIPNIIQRESLKFTFHARTKLVAIFVFFFFKLKFLRG